VDVRHSLQFAEALRADGHDVTVQDIEEARHGYVSWLFYLSDWGRLAQSALDRFMAETLAEPRAQP